MKNARAKRAKILFFIVEYANLWGFCCRRRRGCLSSLLLNTIYRQTTESTATLRHVFPTALRPRLYGEKLSRARGSPS